MDLDAVEQLARQLMDKHGLSMWSFRFSCAKKTFGQVDNYNILCISKLFAELNNKEHVQDVILHEIAHVLVGLGHVHNEVFRAKALAIGCNPMGIGRKSERILHLKDVIRPEPRYGYECPNCHKIYKREKRYHKPIACRKCCIQYNNKKWSKGYILAEIKGG
jgi:hypothetical protein